MNESNARESLCWHCKHGMCVREVHREPMIQFGTNQSRGDDPYGIQAEMPFNNQEDSEVLGHIVEHEQVRTICFWRPATVKIAPPLSVSFVKECNRFEKT